jgi:HAD superfamily hydrolase (TIGR01484 family)
MSAIKLVLSDVDGTLVPLLSDKPSQTVIDAIMAVQDKGVDVAPVTGRPYDFMKGLFEVVTFHDYGVFDAGASVRKVATGEVVWKNWLSVERIQSILQILLPVSEIVDYFPDFKEVKADEVTIESVTEDAPYVFAFVKDDEHGKQAIAELKKDMTLSVNVHYAHEAWEGFLNIQITDHMADKYHGVMALRELAHSKPEETLAIGDSGNDLPLFKAAGVKVAMGNAIQELKELADHVVASVDDDGFAEAMHKFVLTD